MLAVAVAMAAGVGGAGGARPAQDESRERVYVLLRDNRLLVLDAASGRVVARHALAARAGQALTSGPRLALSRNQRTLYALVDAEPDAVVAIDVRTLRVVARRRLEPRLAARSVALAPDGSFYVAGNRSRPVGSDATVTRLKPDGALETVTVREGDPQDWFVYAAALSYDGSRFLLSYHGGCGEGPARCTGGGDLVEAATLAYCTSQRFRDSGCVGNVHGRVVPYRAGWIAARGEPELALLDAGGNTTALVDTKLQTHLMDFALAGETVYALGDCFKGTGVRVVSLGDRSSRRLGPASLCGTAIAAGSRSVAVIRRESRVLYQPSVAQGVVLVDRRSGRVVRVHETSSPPLDVLVG